MNRKIMKSIFQNRYKRVCPVDGSMVGICFYCGDLSEVEDHFPPLSKADCFSVYDDIQWLLVPSCRECNMLASDSVQDNLLARKEHIQDAIRRRYKKVLNKGAHWYQDEIEEIAAENPGSSLIQSLKDIKAACEATEERLAFPGFAFDEV